MKADLLWRWVRGKVGGEGRGGRGTVSIPKSDTGSELLGSLLDTTPFALSELYELGS